MQSGTQYTASGDGNRKKIPSGAEIDYINASQNLLIDNAGGYQSADGSSIQTYFITPFGVTKKVSTNDYIVVGADRAESNPDYPFYKDLIYFPNGAITKKTTAEELQITVTGWVYYHCTPAGAGATLANAATLPVQDELNYYYAIAKVTLTAGVITEITQYQYGPIVLTGMYFDEGMILEGPGIDITYAGAVATVTSLLESTDGTIDVSLGIAGAAHDISVDVPVPVGTTDGSVLRWEADNNAWEESTNILITDAGLVAISGAYTLPGVDGVNGQVIQTNGAGVSSWATPFTGYTSTVAGSILTGNGAAAFAEDTNNLFIAGQVDIMKDAAGDVMLFADAAAGETPDFEVWGRRAGDTGARNLTISIDANRDAAAVISGNINTISTFAQDLEIGGSDDLAGTEGLLVTNASSQVGLAVFNDQSVQISGAYTLPTADGTANQVLQTDGAGAVSWAAAGGGYSSTVAGSILTGDGAGDFAEDTQHLRTSAGTAVYKQAVDEDATDSISHFLDSNRVLFAEPGGDYNTALNGPLPTGVTGNSNISIGPSSCASITSGSSTIGIGRSACNLVSTGSQNIGIGINSLTKVTTNQYNIALGGNALQNVTSAANVGIGYNALKLSTTGLNNFALGYLALSSLTAGSDNYGIATQGFENLASGSSNVALGAYVMRGGAGSYYSGNIGIGDRVADSITTGGYNLIIGFRSGRTLTTGANNLIIGRSLTTDAAGTSNQFKLGNSTSNATPLLIGDLANNKLGIGTGSVPTEALEVSGDVEISGLTASKPVWTNGSKKLISQDIYSDPGATVTTIGSAAEGSEAAETTTWTAGTANGLELYDFTRVAYYDAGNETLYGYVRKLVFNKYGVLYSVGAETRVTIDVPVV